MMKRVMLLLLAVVSFAFTATAGDKDKKKKADTDKKSATTAASTTNDKEINWMTLDDVQAAMRKEPRKVLVDFYTSWCGWCKVMDRKTYSNPEIIKYINEKFYAVKFDAERKDTVSFLNKEYGFNPQKRANEFAVLLIGENLSYPTTVFLMENFQTPSALPGFQDVPKMEMILKYLGENTYKSTQFPEYQKAFVPTFKVLPDVPVSPGGTPAH